MYMTMLKSMHTLFVDLKAHTGTRSSTLQTVTHECIHAGEYYSDCNLYISDICEDHTHTHNN